MMLSLRALLIDCGIWQMTQTLYREMDLPESDVLEAQQKMKDQIAATLTRRGIRFVDDYQPGL